MNTKTPTDSAARAANTEQAIKIGQWALDALETAGFYAWRPGIRAGHNLSAAMRDYDPDMYGVGEPAALLFGYLDDRDGGDGMLKPLAEPMARAYAQALREAAGSAMVRIETLINDAPSPAVVISDIRVTCPQCAQRVAALTADGVCPRCQQANGLLGQLADLYACKPLGQAYVTEQATLTGMLISAALETAREAYGPDSPACEALMAVPTPPASWGPASQGGK